MDAVKFIEERNRMCGTMSEMWGVDAAQIVKNTEEWSAVHPLREYLDTELTPEEIDMDHEAAEQLRHLCRNCDLERLEKLAEADRAGRLVVLPCKVGDTVYVINRHLGQIFANTVISISVGNSTDLKNYIRTKWVGEKGNESIRKWTLRQVGRYVFLSREEAEKALEAMQDGN